VKGLRKKRFWSYADWKQKRLKQIGQALSCPLIPEDMFDALEREEEELTQD